MKITWYGHATIGLEHEGKHVLFDPFLIHNPAYSLETLDNLPKVDALVLTHGHNDHIADAAGIIERDQPVVCSNLELAMFLAAKGAKNLQPMNKGGTVDLGFATVSMTNAFHSSSWDNGDGSNTYLGEAAGMVVKWAGHALYHMGDTEIFGDMALINELHKPDVAFVPIGDRFTMGAESAALACNRFFDFRKVLPIHHSTFPLLTGTPAAFKAGIKKGEMIDIAPMGSVTL